MKFCKILAVATLGIVASGVTASAVADVVAPVGWYVEGNLGQSRTSGVNYTPGTSSSTKGTGFGWNLTGGFRFMPYFAAELGYTHYADATAKVGGVKVADDAHYALEIDGKGIMPLNDSGFELFAKLGLSAAHSHVTSPTSVSGVTVKTGSNRSTGIYFGLGGDYMFTPSLAMILQWARSHSGGSVGNMDLYSVGISYTFT